MTLVVDKYYRRIFQNIDNVRMKFDISALLVKSKDYDSKIDTNKENIAENLSLINSKSDIIEDNKNNISENLTLIQTKIDNIEDIYTKVTNNYNITQINKKNIDFKTGIIDNQITAINSTLNDLKTKYSIENFLYITLK